MNTRLYVGGLAYDTPESALEQVFAQAGEVGQVHVVTDRETGRSKGFAFVEMDTEDEARRAVEMFHGSILHGRRLTVDVARPRPQRAGGFGGSRRDGDFGGSDRHGGGRRA